MHSKSLLSVKDGKPLSFVAAVEVACAVAAHLKAVDAGHDTVETTEQLRKTYADYRECIELNARYKK